MPEGAHLLLRLDLVRLRRFWRGRPWRRHLSSDPISSRLHARIGADLLQHADVLLVAMWLDSTAGVGRILLLARGPRTDGLGLASRARRSIDGTLPRHRERGSQSRRARRARRAASHKRSTWTSYREVALTDDGPTTTALLSPFVVASGPRNTVLRAVDLLRALPGRSSAREDPELLALWRLVAARSAGRPPMVAAALRLPAELRERISKRLSLPAPVHRMGLRLSGGSWLTLRAFMDVAGRKRGKATVLALQRWVLRAVATRVGRRLALARLLTPLSVHHEGGRVYIQWALSTAQLDRHASRLTPLLKALGKHGPARASPRRGP